MNLTCLMDCVVNTYTKVTTGSKWGAVVVKNLMAVPITITKSIKVTQVVETNVVPPVKLMPRTLEGLDKIQVSQQMRMSVEWRKETLFQQLDLSGLKGCLKEIKQLPEPWWLSTMTSFPLNQERWVVQTWQSMRSGSLMTNLSKRVLKDPPSNDGWSLHTHEGNARGRYYMLFDRVMGWMGCQELPNQCPQNLC